MKRQLGSFSYSRTTTNLAWQDIYSSKLPQTKEFLVNSEKAGGNNGLVYQPFSELHNTFTVLSENSSGLCGSKGIADKTINAGHFTSFLIT